MTEKAKSIRGQYVSLICIFLVALVAWIAVAGMYKVFGYTPETIVEPGDQADKVISFLQKPLTVIGLLLALTASAVAAGILWRIEGMLTLLRGSWRISANMGVGAFYLAASNAAAALIGLYLMGVTPALGTAQDLARNLLPFSLICLFVPLAAGIWLTPPVDEKR